MVVAAGNWGFMACPMCGSKDLYRSRGRGIYERVVLRVFDRYPYRCKQCGVRFYTKRPKLGLVSSPDSRR